MNSLKITAQSLYLDKLRWIAAFFVVIGHLRSIIFEDYSSKINNPILKIFYLLTGFGHQAVIIFFVLSGYLIGGSILNQLKKNEFSIKIYSINRFSRIYIVLIPALILTLFFDKIGHFFNPSLYTSNATITSLQINPSSRLTLEYFLSSLFMLQNIWLKPFGSNGPLWSLSIECIFYVLAPILIKVFYKSNTKTTVIFSLILIIFFCFIPQYLYLFIIWCCGFIPYFFKLPNKYLKWSSLAFLLIFLVYNRLTPVEDYSDGIIAVLIALNISFVDNIIRNKSIENIHFRLASFSYSLYIIHYPIILCIITLLNTRDIIQIKTSPTLGHFIFFLLVLAVTYALCYLFSLATEKNTMRLKRILIQLFE